MKIDATELKAATALEKKYLAKYGKTSGQLGQLHRDRNNKTIEDNDGHFCYGTNEGDFYGTIKTHEEYVCAYPKLLKYRSELVVGDLERRWKVEKADMPKLLAKRVLLGKIIL